MSVTSGPDPVVSNLVFNFDMSNTQKSWIGPPTTNLIASTPLTLSTYAYASGPISIANVPDANKNLRTVRRYTVTNNINTARAAVYPSGLTTNTNYSFSCKIKYNGTNTVTPVFEANASKGNPEGGANNNTISSTSGGVTDIGNGWYYLTYTWQYSACPTGACMLTYGVVTGSDAAYLNNTFDIYDEQFEVSAFATPFVSQSNGVRSNTQSILDITRNNTIPANSLTYSSTGTFSFNGTTDFMRPNISHSYLNSSCLEVVFNSTSHGSGFKTIFGYAHNPGYSSPTIGSIFLNGTILSASVITTTQVYRTVTSPTLIDTNTTYHVCLNKDTVNGILELYVNGMLMGTQTFDAATYAQWNTVGNFIGQNVLDIGKSSNMSAGQGWATDYFSGSIYLAKVYSRTLTANEIMQNFKSIRYRYGI